ncbi:MAG: hypothetical protein EBU66_07475 [Bacteroidetes bacterium]|jgi:hypothetical protein|nr:hypothetical protein [bacterium]NBP64485.1 hypothetical protein [Bacteroidota bacterium]
MMKKEVIMEILKWVGTLCVILAATCRAFDMHTADLVLSIVGAGIWGGVAIKMNDKALLTVNGFIVAILLYGVVK